MGSITKVPQCVYCGQVFETWTGNQCQCPKATESRVARQADLDAKAAMQAKQRLIPFAPAEVDYGWAKLRSEAAKDQAAAAREAKRDAAWEDVKDRRLELAQQDLDEREYPQDTPAEGLTLADFRQEVSLLDVERLPSAFERLDGATLLYEGVANTLYGEPSTGKSWIALMVAIQQLRAGRRVIWWDSEDRASTLARRLQLLRATDLIGHPNLKWISGEIQGSPAIMAEALAYLEGGSGPGLVVIDSATSFGCPKDGADVQPWVKAHIKPWINAGHTSLLLDHVPKQRKDRPAGGVGSFEKLSDIRGAALYAHGTAWNGQQGGAINLTIHKDAHGQLPAPKFSVVATITAEWDGPTLDWRVDLPNAKAEGENLEDELLEALEAAGPDGVKGSRAIRDLLKGKRNGDIDKARDELLTAGLIERVKEGNAWRYVIVN